MSKKKAKAAEARQLTQAALAGWGVAPVAVAAPVPPTKATKAQVRPAARLSWEDYNARFQTATGALAAKATGGRVPTPAPTRPAPKPAPVGPTPEPFARAVPGGGRIVITVADIVTEPVDAIVNAANSGLWRGGGVCGAIHAAGGPAIGAACKAWVARWGEVPAGGAAITPAGKLPARWVVHAVGPIWGKDAPDLLWNAHEEALALAGQQGCKTIAFPLISTGIYGMPLETALPLAFGAMLQYLGENPEGVSEVRLVVRDAATQRTCAEALADLLAPPVGLDDPHYEEYLADEIAKEG